MNLMSMSEYSRYRGFKPAYLSKLIKNLDYRVIVVTTDQGRKIDVDKTDQYLLTQKNPGLSFEKQQEKFEENKHQVAVELLQNIYSQLEDFLENNT